MSKQNIYDNDLFFQGYKKIRENRASVNDLIEKPALFSMIGDLKGLKILDLGCGYGENCISYKKMGAKKVLGIDLSEKMLNVAKENYQTDGIEYKQMAIEDIEQIQQTFDYVISSLAMHYIKDFNDVLKKIYKLLKVGGYFIFSQENPVNTCFAEGDRWRRDEDGHVICANLFNYSIDGKRESKWFVEDVIKYHRTFSTIINDLINAGFEIEKLAEPIASRAIMEKYPRFKKDIHKPDLLLVKVLKR